MNEHSLDWCAANAIRNYPVREDANTQGLPRQLLVDLSVFVADPALAVYLVSVRRSTAAVSLAFADAQGTALLVLTAAITAIPAYKPVPLVSLDPRVTGTVSFGNLKDVPLTDVRAQLPLDFRTLFYVPETPVSSIGAAPGLEALTGIVRLEGAGYIRLTADPDTNTVRVALNASPEIFSLFSGPCIDGSEGACPSEPVRSVSGVPADATGVINLVIRNAN